MQKIIKNNPYKKYFLSKFSKASIALLSISIFILLLQSQVTAKPIDYNNDLEEINDDPTSISRGYESFDTVIEAILEGGGSYTKLLYPESQVDWADLVDYLDNTPPSQIYVDGINLPLDIQVYGMAESNKEIVTYYHNVKKSAEFKVRVDSKGMFSPNTKVVLENNGRTISGTQVALANDFYEVIFEANANQRVDILIGRTSLTDTGLYNVVLTKLKNI